MEHAISRRQAFSMRSVGCVFAAGMILISNCAFDLMPGEKINVDGYQCNTMSLHILDSDTLPVFNATLKFSITDGWFISADLIDYKETETYSRYDGHVDLGICGENYLWDTDTFDLEIAISHPMFRTVYLSVNKLNYSTIDSVFLTPAN